MAPAARVGWETLAQAEKREIIRKGLPEITDSHEPKMVAIVGAGISGLVAGFELLKAGYNVTIYEAQQQVGGRIRTLRDAFSHGLYADAGAMRIPSAHILTMEYIDNAVHRAESPIGTTEFRMACENSYGHFGGSKIAWCDYAAEPSESLKAFGFNLEDRESNNTIDRLFARDVLEPIQALMNEESRSDLPPELRLDVIFRDGRYDEYSTRGYLRKCGWSKSAIDAFGLIQNQQARLNNGVTALIREYILGSLTSDRFVQIDGGMDLLPRSFLAGPDSLEEHIQFGSRVEQLRAREKNSVGIVVQGRDARIYHHAVIAIPFPLLRHVDLRHARFSPEKHLAIQGLNYSEAGKIFLQCRRRFWEHRGINGGRTQTDLGIRAIWYPTVAPGTPDGRTVLLASYTWGRDSQKWAFLNPRDRIRYAARDVMRVHDEVFKQDPDLIEGGTSVMWQNEEFAGGAFALTNPWQADNHKEHCKSPEPSSEARKLFHFAGEHTSVGYHRWIEGAIESGLRAAYEIREKDWREQSTLIDAVRSRDDRWPRQNTSA